MTRPSRFNRLTILALATGAASMVGAAFTAGSASAQRYNSVNQCRSNVRAHHQQMSSLTARLDRTAARSHVWSSRHRINRVVNRAKARANRIMAERTYSYSYTRSSYRYQRTTYRSNRNTYRRGDRRSRYHRMNARCQSRARKLVRANRVLGQALNRVKRIKRSSYRTDRRQWRRDHRSHRTPRVAPPPRKAPRRDRDHRTPRTPRF